MLAVPSTLRRVEALQEGSVGDRPSGFGAIAGVRFTIRSRKEKGRTTVLIQSPSRRPVFQGALRQRHCSHCCTRATRSSKCSIELRLGSQVDFGRQSYLKPGPDPTQLRLLADACGPEQCHECWVVKGHRPMFVGFVCGNPKRRPSAHSSDEAPHCKQPNDG